MFVAGPGYSANFGFLRAGTPDAVAAGMGPLDVAPALSLSLGAARVRKPQNPRRRAWFTSAAIGVIACILGAWGSAPPSAVPLIQVESTPAAPVSDGAALASACDAGGAIACNDLGVVSVHATLRSPRSRFSAPATAVAPTAAATSARCMKRALASTPTWARLRLSIGSPARAGRPSAAATWARSTLAARVWPATRARRSACSSKPARAAAPWAATT